VPTLIVTVLAGCCEPIPSACVARKPVPAASASAATSGQKLLAKLTILPLCDPDPSVLRSVDLLDPLPTLLVGLTLLPADVPGGAQHRPDPREEGSERGDLIC